MGFLTWNTKLNGDISRIGFNPSPLKLSQSFKPLPKGEGRVSLIFLFPLLVCIDRGHGKHVRGHGKHFDKTCRNEKGVAACLGKRRLSCRCEKNLSCWLVKPAPMSEGC